MALRSIHPQGWVPIETCLLASWSGAWLFVAFTPKGGCPLKPADSASAVSSAWASSIHPQGWVPIETGGQEVQQQLLARSIHPQGWVPIETLLEAPRRRDGSLRSIHPQGWVPIETCPRCDRYRRGRTRPVAFTPKGGCLLKRKVKVHVYLLVSGSVAFTPKGGCPLKLVGVGVRVPNHTVQ